MTIMKKVAFYLSVFFSILACQANGFDLEKRIPDSELVGALEKIETTFELNDGKAVKNGKQMILYGIVPASIKREQVRPTLLYFIKTMKSVNPGCEWMMVYLPPVENRRYGVYAGIGEYREGKINLSYGVPSNEHLQQWNDMIGKETTCPITKEKYIVNHRPLMRPNDEIVRLGYRAMKTRFDIKESTGRLIAEGEADAEIAESLSCDVHEVSQALTIMYQYFEPMAWGSETF